MTIDRINLGLPVNDKISQLNDQTAELDGRTQQAAFDLYEIDNLYSGSGLPRQYKRNVSLSAATGAGAWYNWTHLKAESGYSIWRFDGAINYAANMRNELYFNQAVMEYLGTASSEDTSVFDNVFFYDGVYNNHTVEAGVDAGTEFSILESTSDFLYVGASAKFSGIRFKFNTKGSNITLKAEYSINGGTGWSQLSPTAFADNFTYIDNTSAFRRDGNITFTQPSNWVATTVNSQSRFWIRFSSTTLPVNAPTAFLIAPINSVVTLLALSSAQVLNREWQFCDYGGEVYGTFLNNGDSSVEGIRYITSSSSAAQKQNFFRFQNQVQGNFQDALYNSSGSGLFIKRADGTAPLRLQQLGGTNTPVLEMTATTSINIGSKSGSGIFIPVKWNNQSYFLQLYV